MHHGPRAAYLLAALAFCLSTAAFAQGAPQVVPAAPAVGAQAYVLQDFHSGRMVAESNADARMEPASLTKMMTVYVISHELAKGNLRLADQVHISEKAWRTEGSRMFVEVDTKVSVEDLLRGVIIQSGNDASVALAEHVAGSEEAFAQLMNQHAQRLGMTGTHFTNSTGLPNPEHYTTARDMAILAAATIRDFPDHYSWYAEKEFTYNGITQYNRNKLLWRDPSVDGIKTGHTRSAGYCLVSSARKDGMRLISVVMGADSVKARTAESQKLLTFGFRFYETHRLYGAGEPLSTPRLWMGARDTVPLGLAEDLYVTVVRGQYKNLKASMTLDGYIEAPVSRGQSFGTVQLELGGEAVDQRPLVALEAVEEGGLFSRIWDSIRLQFHRLLA